MGWLKWSFDLISQGWFGSAVGLVGIGAALLTYLFSRQRKRISYSYSGRTLLGANHQDLPEEISVTYEGRQINKLSRIVFIFWNSGEKIVVGDDIVRADPVRFDFGEEGVILSASVISQSRPVIGAQVKISDHNDMVFIDFDFLDPNDGVVIEVLHSGPRGEFSIYGTVKGLPKGLTDMGKTLRMSEGIFTAGISRAVSGMFATRNLGWMSIFFGGVFSCAALFLPAEVWTRKVDAAPAALIGSMAAIYLASGLFILYVTRRKYPKSLIVDGVDR